MDVELLRARRLAFAAEPQGPVVARAVRCTWGASLLAAEGANLLASDAAAGHFGRFAVHERGPQNGRAGRLRRSPIDEAGALEGFNHKFRASLVSKKCSCAYLAL